MLQFLKELPKKVFKFWVHFQDWFQPNLEFSESLNYSYMSVNSITLAVVSTLVFQIFSYFTCHSHSDLISRSFSHTLAPRRKIRLSRGFGSGGPCAHGDVVLKGRRWWRSFCCCLFYIHVFNICFTISSDVCFVFHIFHIFHILFPHILFVNVFQFLPKHPEQFWSNLFLKLSMLIF